MKQALTLITYLLMIVHFGEALASEDPMTGEEPVFSASQYEVSDRTKKMADNLEKDILSGKSEKRIHRGLDTLIRIAAYKLKRSGHKKEGFKLLKEWQEQYFFDYAERLHGARHIGDHEPVSLWLKKQMDLLSFLLGAETFYNLRFSDIATFNETPKVILFCNDDVDEDEYFLHWVHDADVFKRGLAPTTMFWVAEASCLTASLSAGFILCAPICLGAEWLVKNYVAPKTSNFMWKWACNQ